MMNSANFMLIPDETEIWFNELALLLDMCCELVLEKRNEAVKFSFQRLMDLIDRFGEGDIVFAHECGEWMINCRHKYREIYAMLLQEHGG